MMGLSESYVLQPAGGRPFTEWRVANTQDTDGACRILSSNSKTCGIRNQLRLKAVLALSIQLKRRT